MVKTFRPSGAHNAVIPTEHKEPKMLNLNVQARIYPVRQENKVKMVAKQQNGDLAVTLNSGESYTVSKDDEGFQAFVVYTMLADL